MKTESDPAASRHGEPWRMNFDVLLLIAALAHPRDLWSFAFTCKRFRELLMDRSSVPIWKTARSKFQGMPDCPADLTEQEYVDLAFCARCYSCRKYASPTFWEMRRRYCPDCRLERLCRLPSCPEIVQNKYVLGMANIAIGEETPFWVDKEQMKSFMEEYEHSSNKNQLLSDRQQRLVVIRNHARRCEVWQRGIETSLRQSRDQGIFERLEQLGYEADVEYVGRYAIRESRKYFFNTSKPLTDKEWGRVWPEWLETMNNFRLQRLEKTVFQSRRHSLVNEYEKYVTHPSSDTPSFDLLPHVTDVARFLPFRDIIRAPEETPTNGKLFGSAFAQLPRLVGEWKKQLDAELAELVEIPSRLSSDGAAGGETMQSSSKTEPESSYAPREKLRLACALFRTATEGLFTYPEVLFNSMSSCKYPRQDESDSKRTGSIWERFGIKYVKEAPYIIHACGLDPNVATVDDIDRKDARLQCLSCSYARIYNWREATWHAHFHHEDSLTRWQLITDDSEMALIRAAERTDHTQTRPHSSRCLLCRPRVGDEKSHNQIESHLEYHHKIRRWANKEGVHCASVVNLVEHRSVSKKKRGVNSEEFKFVVTRRSRPNFFFGL